MIWSVDFGVKSFQQISPFVLSGRGFRLLQLVPSCPVEVTEITLDRKREWEANVSFLLSLRERLCVINSSSTRNHWCMQHVDPAEKAARLNNTQQDANRYWTCYAFTRCTSVAKIITASTTLNSHRIHRTLFPGINQKHWQTFHKSNEKIYYYK